jgi:hypothetical protein
MPDLGALLGQMLGDTGTSIFQAVVDAVGTGVVTIRLNGSTFTDVPYVTSAFYPATAPAINDRCYVLAQKDWGMVVIGKPAPGAVRGGGSAGVYLWEPDQTGEWNFSTHSNPPTQFSATLTQTIAPYGTGSGQSTTHEYAIWHYLMSGNPLPGGSTVATASLMLSGSWTSDGSSDWDYVEIGLYSSNLTDLGDLVKVPGASATYRFPTVWGPAYSSIPLDWIDQLAAGTAKGIYLQTLGFPLTLTGSGELRLTTL